MKGQFDRLKQFSSGIGIIDLNTTSAIRASSLRVQIQTEGIDIGLSDTLIASITIENGGLIVTDNAEHFSRINGLEIIKFDKT